MVAIVKRIAALTVANIQRSGCNWCSVWIIVSVYWKTIEGLANNGIVPGIFRFLNHASWLYMIVIVITTSRVATANIQLPGQQCVLFCLVNGVEVGGVQIGGFVSDFKSTRALPGDWIASTFAKLIRWRAVNHQTLPSCIAYSNFIPTGILDLENNTTIAHLCLQEPMYPRPVSFSLQSLTISPITKGSCASKEKLSALSERWVVVKTLFSATISPSTLSENQLST